MTATENGETSAGLVSRRRFTRLCLTIGLLVLGFLAVYRSLLEPRYGGKSLTAWIKEAETGISEGNGEAALEAVRRIGPAAVPHLLRWLRAEDSRWKDEFNEWAGRIGFTPAFVWHQRAVLGFHALGTNATTAIPALIRLLDEPQSGPATVRALAELGPEALSALLQAVTNRSDVVRYSAIGSLGGFPTESVRTLPALLHSLKDPDPKVRRVGVFVLGRLGQEPDQTVPALIAALKDSSSNVSLAAIRALGDFGPKAQPAVPHLRPILRSAVMAERMGAGRTLARIDPEAALAAYVENLNSPDLPIRRSVVTLLGETNLPVSKVLPLLMQQVQDGERELRFAAILVLTRLGTNAVTAAPELEKALHDPDNDVQAAAAQALHFVAPDRAKQLGIESLPRGRRGGRGRPVARPPGQ